MQRNPTSLRRKVKRTYFVERVRERDHILDRTEREDMVVYQDDNMLTCICFARHCCLSYSSFSTWTSRCCGCIYALSSLPFSCQGPSSLLLLLQFFPFRHQANETTSAATVLRTIFLSTSGTSGRGKSKPHPPTKTMHCKISSPTLRRLAKMVSNK